MLHNASHKISICAQIILIAGIILSIAAGFLVIWNGLQNPTLRFVDYHTGSLYRVGVASSMSGTRVIAGFLIIIFGSLVSWLLALLLQAFSNLTADTRVIREKLEAAIYGSETSEPVYSVPAEPLDEKAEVPNGSQPVAEETATQETPAETESK